MKGDVKCHHHHHPPRLLMMVIITVAILRGQLKYIVAYYDDDDDDRDRVSGQERRRRRLLPWPTQRESHGNQFVSLISLSKLPVVATHPFFTLHHPHLFRRFLSYLLRDVDAKDLKSQLKVMKGLIRTD